MEYFLYTIFFVSCFVLIAAVLLQPGKTDAGALFTSNVSSSALAPRGTATILSKVTIAAAASFMISALLLAMPALTGNVSVLTSNPDAPAANVESNLNIATDSNANTATPINGNSAAAPVAAPAGLVPGQPQRATNSAGLVPDEGNGTQVKDVPAKDAKKPDEKKK